MDDVTISKKDFTELIKLIKEIRKKIESIYKKANIDFEKSY